MTTRKPKSAFTRPAFIASAVVIGIIAILGVVLALTGKENDPAPLATPTPNQPAATSPQQNDDPLPRTGDNNESVCGLPSNVDGAPIGLPPDADWMYAGVYAYPTSEEFGPAASAGDDYQYCFQRSQEGALFFAAYAAAHGDGGSKKWFEYAVSNGSNRSKLLSQVKEGSTDGRMEIRGFRLLDYTAESALVDIAISLSYNGNHGYASGIYNLVWEDGDWKLNADVDDPLNVEVIPNLSGYTLWGRPDGS